jgi:hypothetical protein
MNTKKDTFCVIYGVNEHKKGHKKDNLNRPDSESYLQSTLSVIDQTFIGVVLRLRYDFFLKGVKNLKIF